MNQSDDVRALARRPQPAHKGDFIRALTVRRNREAAFRSSSPRYARSWARWAIDLIAAISEAVMGPPPSPRRNAALERADRHAALRERRAARRLARAQRKAGKAPD